jgi:type I restriction enzyme S subunit
MSELPEGWARAKLGDLITLKYGKSLPEKSRIKGPFCVYGSNGIVGSHREAITSAPAIMVGRKGSIGEIHLSDKPCFPIDTTYYIDEFYGQSPYCLKYLLKTLGLT